MTSQSDIRMSPRGRHFRGALTVLAFMTVALPGFAEEDCDYGPPNLLKTIRNPFNSNNAGSGPEDEGGKEKRDSDLGSISLSTGSQSVNPSPVAKLARSSLRERLIASRMFLPERMLIGATAKFTVKAKPGMHVAIAMADRDKGSKPILGHSLRLGPDRKVVAITKVPESGIAELYVETPIEGDLIGQYLYFEAALWSKPDMSDLEIADTVTSAVIATPPNAVMVAQAAEAKRGVRIVPDSAMPMTLRQGTGATSLGSGP